MRKTFFGFSFVFLLIFTALGQEKLPHYHRFFTGYPLPNIEDQPFEEGMNHDFLPLFEEVHPQGLIAYRPTLPKQLPNCKIPNEIALLTFENEKIYSKYRSSN